MIDSHSGFPHARQKASVKTCNLQLYRNLFSYRHFSLAAHLRGAYRETHINQSCEVWLYVSEKVNVEECAQFYSGDQSGTGPEIIKLYDLKLN